MLASTPYSRHVEQTRVLNTGPAKMHTFSTLAYTLSAYAGVVWLFQTLSQRTNFVWPHVSALLVVAVLRTTGSRAKPIVSRDLLGYHARST